MGEKQCGVGINGVIGLSYLKGHLEFHTIESTKKELA